MAGFESSENKFIGVLRVDSSKLDGDLKEVKELLNGLTDGTNFNLTDTVKTQMQRFLAQLKQGLGDTKKSGEETGEGLSVSFGEFVEKNEVVLSQIQKLDKQLNVVRTTMQTVNKETGALSKVNLGADGNITGVTSTTQLERQNVENVNNAYNQRARIINEIIQREKQLVSADYERSNVLRQEIQMREKTLDVLRDIIDDEKDRTGIDFIKEEARDTEALIKLKETLARIDADRKDNAVRQASAQQEKQINDLYKEQLNLLKQIEDYSKKSSKAYSQGNTSSGDSWAARAQNATAAYDANMRTLESMEGIKSAETAIVNLQNQRAVSSQRIADYERQNQAAAQQTNKVYDQIAKTITTIATAMVMKAISNAWKEATAYARSYYDALNEIRIVTGMTEEQANRLGESYRTIAKDMSISSETIAKGAVEYYRQGLSDAEVVDKLTETVQFAKVAALDFEYSIELMTASTNGFGRNAKEVSDVFVLLGDLAATGKLHCPLAA